MTRHRRAVAVAVVAALLGALVLPAPALAEAPLPPPATAPARVPRVAVTMFLLPHPGVPNGTAEKVLRSLERALKKNKRLAVKDSAKLLANYAGEVPTDLIAAARKLLADGSQLLLDLDTPAAIKKLGQAIEALEQVLPFIHKNELADAMLAQAVAFLAAGDRKPARHVLQRLLTWRETLTYDSEKYPPKYLEAFEEARKDLRRRPRGSIEIRSLPDGAQAYVDGRYVGVTPTTAEGLLVGDHYVTLKKEGYLKTVIRAAVNPKRQGAVTAELKRSEKYKLVHDSLARASVAVEEEVADPGMLDLKAFLFIDQAIFLRLKPIATGVHVDAYLFDLRSKRRLSVVRRDLDPKALGPTGTGLAENLYLNVPYDGSLVAPPEEKPPEPRRRRPFYKTWWFWTAIGVTATAIIIPVSVMPSESRAPEPFRRVDVQMF